MSSIKLPQTSAEPGLTEILLSSQSVLSATYPTGAEQAWIVEAALP
ncbi:MAG: hypothetical protein IPO63_17075 [Bacteroidetes bacterium]|nr:hypothetical protein [Bacteroidota bacterium]